mgnify:CR=1 FL=1
MVFQSDLLCLAMLELPSRVEIGSQVGFVALIEFNNAIDAIAVAIRVRHHGVRREFKAIGIENQMFRNVSGSRQILFKKRLRER